MNKTSYLICRLAIATSMFGHGLVRLPKLAAFSDGMVVGFQKSILPKTLVLPFAYALPFAEFGVGLLLLIGLFTKQTLIIGSLIMIILIFGSTTVEHWENIPLLLMHVAFFALLLHYVGDNTYAVDNLLKK